MPPALSPSARVRSRTSDLSDFLRGRSDPKSSTELHPPPLPPLPDQATPKAKSKFAFLARKRKSSFTPSSAKQDSPTTPSSSHDAQSPGPSTLVPPAPDGHQPSPPGRTSPQKTLPALPPLTPIDISVSPSAAPSPRNQHLHQAIPSLLHHVRKQKGSSDSTRQSNPNESRSLRPIITVSPPHNAIHEGEGAYTTPRTAPTPSRIPSFHRSKESTLPTPSSSDRTPSSSPASASPATSTASNASASRHATDNPLPEVTSYKEESLLRKDHFDLGSSNSLPRRGTLLFNSSGRPTPVTVGPSFSSARQDRRHVSVMQLDKLKREITATTPQIRKKSSDPNSLGKSTPSTSTPSPRSSSSLARSNTVAVSPAISPLITREPASQARRIPPPLKRTWHTPPTTGPPKEPLPSPPSTTSETLPAPTPSTAEIFRSSPSPSPNASPSTPRRPLPPLFLARDRRSVLSSRMTSPDSPLSASIPSSPSRSEADSDAPAVKTPVREDPAQRVLGDERASTDQLRDALKLQVEKYGRLSAYLLNLTERHAVEKAELMRKIELLEHDAEKREQEMKGLKWLVANAGRSSPRTPLGFPGPTREDSDALPARSERQGASHTRIVSVGTEESTSFDSPPGSIEGIVELQTSISEFIAPTSSVTGRATRLPDTEKRAGMVEKPVPTSTADASGSTSTRTRLRRSNTVPDAGNRILPTVGSTSSDGPSEMETTGVRAKQAARAARRTSSPVIASPASSSSPSPSVAFPARTSSLKQPSSVSTNRARLGLGLGLGVAASGSPSSSSLGSSSPDPGGSRDVQHARADSSTLSSLPSLATLHSSSSGLSSIPETPRTDLATLDEHDAGRRGVRGFNSTGHERVSTSTSSSSSSSSKSGGSSRLSASPSIGQILDRTREREREREREKEKEKAKGRHAQPEMDAILRKLREFGHGQSP